MTNLLRHAGRQSDNYRTLEVGSPDGRGGTGAWQQRALGHLPFCKIGMVLHLLESSRARRATDRVERRASKARASCCLRSGS